MLEEKYFEADINGIRSEERKKDHEENIRKLASHYIERDPFLSMEEAELMAKIILQ